MRKSLVTLIAALFLLGGCALNIDSRPTAEEQLMSFKYVDVMLAAFNGYRPEAYQRMVADGQLEVFTNEALKSAKQQNIDLDITLAQAIEQSEWIHEVSSWYNHYDRAKDTDAVGMILYHTLAGDKPIKTAYVISVFGNITEGDGKLTYIVARQTVEGEPGSNYEKVKTHPAEIINRLFQKPQTAATKVAKSH